MASDKINMIKNNLIRIIKNNREVFIFSTVYIIILSIVQIRWHMTLNTNGMDLGIYDQAIWNCLHGKFFYSTLLDKSLFLDQFRIILLLFVPIYAFFPSVYVYILSNVIFIGLASIPLYFICIHKTNSKPISLIIATAYLLSKYTIASLFSSHPEAIYPLLFFAIILSILKNNRKLLIITVVISLLVKADTFIYTLFIGAYLLIIKKDRKSGFIVSTLSLLWGIMVFKIIPIIFLKNSLQQLTSLPTYSHLGSNFTEIAWNLITNPLLIINNVLIPAKLITLLELFSSVLFLPLLSPGILFIAAPPILVQILSNYHWQYRLTTYYSASIIPFIFTGAVFGISYIKNKYGKKISIALILSVIIFLISVFDGRFWKVLKSKYIVVTNHHTYFKEIKNMIPDEASVSAQGNLFPHLSHRKVIYDFPVVKDAEYVVLDEKGNKFPLNDEAYKEKVDEILKSNEYEVIIDYEGYLLIRRISKANLERSSHL